MTDKFKGKYRTQTTRWRHWDYGWNAAYFVTICTKNRECWFGKVANGKMILNDIGKIAHDCWLQIPHHFPFVRLGDHVVMPNHVHGIIIIDKPDDGRMDDHDMVEAQNFAPPPPPPHQPPQFTTKNRFGPQSQNLASIIRGLKSGLPKMPVPSAPVLPGNPAIMTMSYAMMPHTNALPGTSRTTLPNGRRIHFILKNQMQTKKAANERRLD